LLGRHLLKPLDEGFAAIWSWGWLAKEAGH
jgi:hypothetical protein